MKRLLLPFVIILVCGHSVVAQTSFVYQRLRSIMNGKADEVRSELAEMAKEKDLSDNPGLIYLQGVVTEDGAKAVVLYEKITHDFPESEWADDAQLRVVQYHALNRDTARAQRELATFKRSYPLSEYLIYAHDLVKATVGVPKSAQSAKGPSTVTSAVVATKPAPVSAKKEESKDAMKENAKESSKDAAKENIAKENVSKENAVSTTRPATDPPLGEVKKYWGWQVGVYSSRKTAETEAQSFKEQRMRVDVIEKEGKFAVVVGHYSAKDSAERSKSLVEAQCACVPYLIEKPLRK